MSFRNKFAYPVLLAFGTTLATGLAAAILSPDGSIARLFGALTIRQITLADTYHDDKAPISQGVTLNTPYTCKDADRVVISCLAYSHPDGEKICDAVVRSDGKGGATCYVGTCQPIVGQRWRVMLTCVKR